MSETMDERGSGGPEQKIATGVEGLDAILGGGLTPRRLYLVEGAPGTGKSTLGLQFLRAGAERGERVLHVSLSETEEELRAAAQTHGWSLEGISIRELIPSEESLQPDQQYTIFHPSEVEFGEILRRILRHAEELRPTRAVIDSLAEMRMLAGQPLRYRRQILALKHFFLRQGCTVLMLDDHSGGERDHKLETLAHGVLELHRMTPEYGAERRRINVVKYRGARYPGGFHDFVIATGGLRVFPRVVAAAHRRRTTRARVSSGVPALDELLGGGLERGTSTLVSGAAGTGKSTLALQFAVHAAAQGQSAAMFIFDESEDTLLARAQGLGIDMRPHLASGRLHLQAIDPAELSPGQFAAIVAETATRGGASVIVVDSLNGYLHAMPEERFLTIQLHELLAFLAHQDVATLLVGVHQGMIGLSTQPPVDASYLADGIIVLRYFELRGAVHQAISIVKKRGGVHERTIREFRLDQGGIQVGAPLREFRGVLTGVPTIEDAG